MKKSFLIFLTAVIVILFSGKSFAHHEFGEINAFIDSQNDDLKVQLNNLINSAKKDISSVQGHLSEKKFETQILLTSEKPDKEKLNKISEEAAQDFKRLDQIFVSFILDFKALFADKKAESRKIILFISRGILFDYFQEILFDKFGCKKDIHQDRDFDDNFMQRNDQNGDFGTPCSQNPAPLQKTKGNTEKK
jgi:hypothetical protein